MTENIGAFLGKMIGEVLDVDLLTAKNVGGRCVKVSVAISADEPLIRSLRVDLLGTRTITAMLLRYERLQDYYFKCSRVGHPLRDCVELGKKDTIETMARLNVWLRTESPPKRFNHRSGLSEDVIGDNKERNPISVLVKETGDQEIYGKYLKTGDRSAIPATRDGRMTRL
ncbi:hypothetical protein Dsin_013517 [Dipteronia sinensis]|uniref:CCHC-type domain-containing protein n=1 Tax=Dipteronia sinensis TaxID=43782 RepID=A0AAE0E9I2_9ROSI|nr:hypothetical protein Dsin_013517 [Dipteronia sinensis]